MKEYLSDTKIELQIQALGHGPGHGPGHEQNSDQQQKSGSGNGSQPSDGGKSGETTELNIIHIHNSLTQTTTDPNGDVNLGSQEFLLGSALEYTSSNIITFKTPGLYQVTYQAAARLASTEDFLYLIPVYNEANKPASALRFTRETKFEFELLPNEKTFYVPIDSTWTLQFIWLSSSENNSFDDFTLTVIKVH